VEHDAQVRDAHEICEDMEKVFNDHRKSYEESCGRLASMLELERQTRQDLMGTESQSHSRQLGKLPMTLSRQFADSHNFEKAASDQRFGEIKQDWERERES